MRKRRVAYPMSSAAEQLAYSPRGVARTTWEGRVRGLHVGTVPSDPKNGMQNPVVSIFYVPSIAMSASEPNNDAASPTAYLSARPPALHPLKSICASNLY